MAGDTLARVAASSAVVRGREMLKESRWKKQTKKTQSPLLFLFSNMQKKRWQWRLGMRLGQMFSKIRQAQNQCCMIFANKYGLHEQWCHWQQPAREPIHGKVLSGHPNTDMLTCIKPYRGGGEHLRTPNNRISEDDLVDTDIRCLEASDYEDSPPLSCRSSC